MKKILAVALIITRASILLGQVDNIGSGHAIRFDGIDDYVDLGNIYDDLVLPFTVSVWVYMDPGATTSGGPILVSQDNAPIYNGFWFTVNPTTILIEYGDGMGENSTAYRRGKSASVPNFAGRWVHVCAVMKSAFDIDLYINGVNVAGVSTGASNLPMASNYPTDVAKIGSFLSNGVTYRFKGTMDHLQIFNRALSDVEIRQNMTKKLIGNEPGLIGYWTFDETMGNTLIDKSPNHFDGQLKGNPTRVYSGAPIGDENIFLYTNSWTGTTLTLSDLKIENVIGNPFGTHIYKVNNSPSQTDGLSLAANINPYYGVFIADNKSGNSFDVKYNGLPCKFFMRQDNSESLWNETAQSTGILNRRELVQAETTANFPVNLGPDEILCDRESTTLLANINSPFGKSFLWNTGATSNTIIVSQSGKYSVKVSEGCKSAVDSVLVYFSKTPPDFSIGKDEIICDLKPRTLAVPTIADLHFTWQWQNGSTQPTFDVKNYGVFWITIKNACGESTDSIKFSKIDIHIDSIPNVITPNGDAYNQYFEIQDDIKGKVFIEIFNRWGKLVFSAERYNNDWSGSTVSTGLYFYRLTGACIDERIGTLHVLN